MYEISLSGIKKVSEAVYNFLKQKDLVSFSSGRYDLEENIFVNIEDYETQPRTQRKYESHRKYVDIQFILKGKEIISICPISELNVWKAYSNEHDMELYSVGANAERKSKNYLINEGNGIMIYPGEGHLPCLNPSNMPCQVKKAVIKIPLARFKDIRYLIMDVDGTLTDGKIYMGCNKEVCKAFNIKDGCGIRDILIPANIEPIVITSRLSKILEQRCKELGIQRFYQSIACKRQQLINIVDESLADLSNVAYIGDDINDLECMRLVKESGGLVGCPFDATVSVKSIADFVCTKAGGDGAVREFIEWIVSSKKTHAIGLL